MTELIIFYESFYVFFTLVDVDVCSLDPETEPCLPASVKSWFYNKRTGTCQKFTYGGCNRLSAGGKNKFDTKSKCLKHCKGK